MFVHMKKLPAKTADAIDLMIEFSTLGEYGLEYPEDKAVDRHADCEPRRSRKDRGPAVRVRTECAQARQGRDCSSETTDFASALRPPRIKLSFVD